MLRWVVAGLAAVPLMSVLYMLIVAGGNGSGLELFTQLPPAGLEAAAASAMRSSGPSSRSALPRHHASRSASSPASYLGIIPPDSRIAAWARLPRQVLTGFPSILAGVFVYARLVLAMGTYSALAGGMALAVLMLPTVTLTAERAMRMVPQAHEGRRLRHGLHP